jgi:RecJ-like exonuclease
MKLDPLEKGLFDHRDMNRIFHLKSPDEVVHLVKKIHDDRSKVDHLCHNFEKYRVEFKSSP